MRVTTNRVRNNLGKGKGGALSLQKYFSVLLAVFVFVLGMLGGGTADAATATETLSRTVTVQFQVTNQKKTAPIQMTVKLDNMDLTAYAKYTAEIQKNDKYKHIVFAKAAPGSKVTITADPAPIPGILAKPAKGMNCTESTKFKNHKKIGTLKELTSLGSDKEYSYGKNYTIPNDVEQVTAVVDLTYHVGGMEVGNEMKTSVGTYHQEPRLYRHYYIFTSDAACKKAYDLMADNSIVGSVVSSVTKPNTDTKSGGLGTIAKVVIGVVVVGAIAFGASRLLKGRGGFKGLGGFKGSSDSGSGNFNSGGPGNGRGAAGQSAATPREPNRFEYAELPAVPRQPKRSVQTNPAAGAQASGRTGAVKSNAAGAVAFCNQCGAPLRSGSRFCANCGAKIAPEFCPNCGEKLEPDCQFCGNCGRKV